MADSRFANPPDLRVFGAFPARRSVENPLWGAPRIRGELLKLGFEVAQSSVAKYMVKRRAPPSQGWRTFLHNHAPDIAAMDLFVVPTIGFDLLYVLRYQVSATTTLLMRSVTISSACGCTIFTLDGWAAVSCLSRPNFT
jgi:hypothetical protein